MLILCNYDACYHSFINFLYWYVILLKSICFALFRVNYVFMDVRPFTKSNKWKLIIFLDFILTLVDD